jgi:hypothetical protein
MIKTATVLNNYSLLPLQALLQHLPDNLVLSCPSPLPQPPSAPLVILIGKYPVEFFPVETQPT